MTRLIRRDERLNHKEKILELIGKFPDEDEREAAIRRLFPEDYAYLRKELYPQLRAVHFKYDLRRVGMIKDTVHTTEPDTLYARGLELLRNRQYPQASYILTQYEDQNTAIVLLSLGHDQRALEILLNLPDTATIQYLRAVAYARLGRKAEGLEHYLKAIELDELLEYRGNLDPEITFLKQ